MKRILIVDDEYIVRLGLKTIVDWAGFGYTIAGEAGNGKEAYDFFEKNPVDLILTDIKMPVMDGLELIRKVKGINKKVQIIILSHYDEFSYAQEAINLGAFRYILKSELTKTNLENLLKSLHFSSEDADPSEQSAAISSDQNRVETFLKEQVLQTFLLPVNFETEETMKYPLPAAEDDTCLVFSVSCRITLLSSDAREKFPKTIRILFDEAFDNLVGQGRYYNNDYQFVAIISPIKIPIEGENPFLEKINNSCIHIVKNVHQYYDVNVFIGVSSAGKTRNFCQLLEEAHMARIDCFFSTGLFVNLFRQKSDAGTANKKIITGTAGMVSYTKLVTFFDTNQKDDMLEYIKNIFTELRINKNYNVVYDVYIDFLSVGKLIHEKYHLAEAGSSGENKFRHDTFFDLPFMDDVEKYIYELYLSLFSTKQNGEASYSHLVKKCIDFMHSEYKNNIGLYEAAVKVGVSHSYLSLVFKQETGVNFNAALTQYRIEKAKKYLTTTSLRIYQVAEQVGFSNPYYFSKVFREITGYTCKEYRDKEPIGLVTVTSSKT